MFFPCDFFLPSLKWSRNRKWTTNSWLTEQGKKIEQKFYYWICKNNFSKISNKNLLSVDFHFILFFSLSFQRSNRVTCNTSFPVGGRTEDYYCNINVIYKYIKQEKTKEKKIKQNCSKKKFDISCVRWL